MRQSRRTLPAGGIELVERIEVHDLDARAVVDLAPRHPFGEEGLGGAVRVGVAVRTRQPAQGAVVGDECHVDAPRVDADRLDVQAALSRQGQAVQNLFVEGIDIPVVFAAERDEAVRKAVEHVEGDPIVRKRGQDHAAARRAQIDGQKMPCIHRGFRLAIQNYGPSASLPFIFLAETFIKMTLRPEMPGHRPQPHPGLSGSMRARTGGRSRTGREAFRPDRIRRAAADMRPARTGESPDHFRVAPRPGSPR